MAKKTWKFVAEVDLGSTVSTDTVRNWLNYILRPYGCIIKKLDEETPAINSSS